MRVPRKEKAPLRKGAPGLISLCEGSAYLTGAFTFEIEAETVVASASSASVFCKKISAWWASRTSPVIEALTTSRSN